MQVLSPDDKMFHEVVNKMVEEAMAVRGVWFTYLIQKYQLKGKDAINKDGSIDRGASDMPEPMI